MCIFIENKTLIGELEQRNFNKIHFKHLVQCFVHLLNETCIEQFWFRSFFYLGHTKFSWHNFRVTAVKSEREQFSFNSWHLHWDSSFIGFLFCSCVFVRSHFVHVDSLYVIYSRVTKEYILQYEDVHIQFNTCVRIPKYKYKHARTSTANMSQWIISQ